AHAAGRRVLRLHEDVWRCDLGAVAGAPSLDVPPRPPSAEREDATDLEADVLDRWLKEATQIVSEGWLSEVLRSVTDTRRRRVVRLRDSHYAIMVRHRSDATTEAEISSFTGVAVGLHAHLDGVGSFAREFAERCRLPVDIVRAIELAGRWHDAGKADPRFQRLLHGGNAYKAAVAPELLAKSALPSSDRRARIRARERSGYPSGYRHELMSAALLLHAPGVLGIDGDVDADLVLHLVASHHGWCRPLAPVAFDADPVGVEFSAGDTMLRGRSDHGLERLDSGVSDRFFLLVRRYGWFGLAWLEAILRLADHRRSEWEQRNIGGTS
ncbi:MAG: CRISPR-associated endonuclease Cas3'', partial [Candidatus Binatia bacterium]